MEFDEYMQARVLERLDTAVKQAASPWVDRAAAAAYAHCSTSEIDRAANAGAFKRYLRGATPMFKKAEIDGAIESGKWPARKPETLKVEAKAA